MKLFKKLATVCMAITMSFGVGMALTACDDNGGNPTNSEQSANATYSFNVTKNGAAAVGYEIQLCTKNADGSLGVCLSPVAVGEDGVAKISISDVNSVYEIHVMKNGTPLEKDQYITSGDVPANYNGGAISVIVND